MRTLLFKDYLMNHAYIQFNEVGNLIFELKMNDRLPNNINDILRDVDYPKHVVDSLYEKYKNYCNSRDYKYERL